MVRATKGALLECDPAVKEIVLDLDNKRSDSGEPRFIIEQLDETHLFIDLAVLDWLKDKLDEILEENTYRVQDLS
ncbi:TFIIH subunit TTDA/Tfb5 [Phlyctochytrium arcticum]|nr:TFIIH subunit TTDA/Tfb5 [Phlyctochytrium arcticum]